MQPFHVQLLDLLLIQLTNWRWSWRGTLVTGIIAPVFSTVAFSIFAADSGVEALGYVLTGNVVLALLLDGLTKVSGHFVFIRMNGTLDYFATLPINRSALIIATVIAFLILSLPSAFTTLFLGAMLLKVPIQISPLIILVVPLISVSLSGLGALIGILARTPEEVNSMSFIATLILFSFGPVMIPLERLPDFMNQLSLISPATYAASALRHVVLNQPNHIPLVVDCVVLALTAAIFLWIVNSRVDWRGRV